MELTLSYHGEEVEISGPDKDGDIRLTIDGESTYLNREEAIKVRDALSEIIPDAD